MGWVSDREYSGASVLVHGHSGRPSEGRMPRLRDCNKRKPAKNQACPFRDLWKLHKKPSTISEAHSSSNVLQHLGQVPHVVCSTQVDAWNKQSQLPYRVLPGDHILEVNDISISDFVTC